MELPSNLKLADPDALVAPEHPEGRARHQVVKPDTKGRSVRHRHNTAVFQRPGVITGPIEVPVVPFASSPEDDSNVPPPPPSETLSLSPLVFGLPLRLDILQQVVKWQLACRRVGASSTKRIGDLRGSTRKVRPQKGTGRARAGHARPPHWRGGAKAHGPVKGGRDWSYKLNKKIRRLGLCTALSQKLAEGNLIVVDSLNQGSHRTKLLHDKLEAMGALDSVIMTHPETPGQNDPKAFVEGENAAEAVEAAKAEAAKAAAAAEAAKAANEGAKRFILASRNLPLSKVLVSNHANVYDLLKREKLVMPKAAAVALQARLLNPIKRKPWE